jgi:inhibitor of KinA
MTQPSFHPVGDQGVLVVFGDTIDSDTTNAVQILDALLAVQPPDGMTETVPTFTTLLVCFDPLVTDHASIISTITNAVSLPGTPSHEITRQAARGRVHEIDVCYEGNCAPDMEAVVEQTGLSEPQVTAAHSSAIYTVGMYGFAPGYAYLHGTPTPIQIPRNPTPGPLRPAGSVIIAGQQCLVIPTPLATGWYAIGRTASSVLSSDENNPFRFDVGDTIRFKPIDEAEFHRQHRACSGIN